MFCKWLVIKIFKIFFPIEVVNLVIPIWDEEFKSYADRVAKRHGYPLEKHEAVTQDGYTLTLFLMPQRKDKKSKSKTVLLTHGVLTSGDCWFINQREAILPFLLYDQGYNVMIGNFRGTTYSAHHQRLPRNSNQYWDFSWDEIGQFDMSTMIDGTLKITKQTKLFVIAHSMGTTATTVLLSERPEYNDKIYKFIALSPLVFQGHSKSPLRQCFESFIEIPRIQLIANILFHGLFPPLHSSFDLLRLICAAIIIGRRKKSRMTSDGLVVRICRKIMENIFHTQEKKIGKEVFESMLCVQLEPSSVRCMLHYVQIMDSGKFQMYDYGKGQNEHRYSTPFPPNYDLTKITCRLALFWSESDLLASREDIEMLVKELINSKGIEVFKIEDASFEHLDYITSASVRGLLNPHVLSCLNSTSEKH